MVVRKWERGTAAGKLDAQTKAEKLVAHTVHIVSNEKVFDPRYEAINNRIVDCAIGIGADIWEANGIRVTGNGISAAESARRYRARKDLQDQAIREIRTMLYLMGIAKRLNKKLRTRKFEYWVKLARETKDLASSWRDSDAHRYGHLIRDAGCNAQRVDELGEPQQREQRGNRELAGQLQQQQRDQRLPRGAGSCQETRRGGRTECDACVRK